MSWLDEKEKHSCEGMVIDKKTSDIVPCPKEGTIFTDELRWYCLECLPIYFDLNGNFKEQS